MPNSGSTSTSDAFAEFQAELQQVMHFKWLESEKEGRDIGFEQALRKWSETRRPEWRKNRREAPTKG